LDKKEYIDPWEIGGLGNLWQWCVLNQCGVIPYLLCTLFDEDDSYIGRWARDRIVLAGDEHSQLYYEVERKEEWKEIGKELIEEFNDFIRDDEYKIGEVR